MAKDHTFSEFFFEPFPNALYYGLMVFIMVLSSSLTLCQELCAADPACNFWSYVLPGIPTANGFCGLFADCDTCIDGEIGFAISGKKGCVE